MRLMLDLGEWGERHADAAIALLAELCKQDATLELAVHLFDTEQGRGRRTLNLRRRLAERVGEANVHVTPYPLSRPEHQREVSLNAGLLALLTRHVSHFVGKTWQADGMISLVPDLAEPSLVPTGELPGLEAPPCLTLCPEYDPTPDTPEGGGRIQGWLDTLPQGRTTTPVTPASTMPRLAFVSPLPPLQTGIADYSAELLEALSPYYTITLITEQDTLALDGVARRFAVRDSQWFWHHGASFDRVLYHWGNSPFHAHMPSLLERHPGSVVLHDFFCGNLARSLAEDYDTFARMLYQAHGYPAVADLLADITQAGLDKVLNRYPLNHQTVSAATGVLVHSRYALELAARWYPACALGDWQKVPFLRRTAEDAPAEPLSQDRRAQARKALGLADDAFVVCTFGLITPNKCVHLLLDAFMHSELADDPDVQLVAVGGYGHSGYRQRLERTREQYRGAGQIHVTGYADAETYRHYLDAADIGVQLRTRSRGETSAAVFDCLAAGLPLVANAHGSVCELDPKAAYLLSEEASAAELADALNALYHSPQRRQALGDAGQRHVARCHNAETVGQAYADAMEALHRRSRRGRYQELLDHVQTLGRREGMTLDQADIAALSASIEAATPPLHLPRLLLDVTNIANHDLRTGIERVTRNLCEVLLKAPPDGYRVELVRSQGGQLHFARAYAAERLGCPHSLGEDEPLTDHPGDIYLSLEWSPPVLAENHAQFQALKARGVKLYFTVFDALPIQFPHHFPGFVEGTYQDWLSRALALADGLCCISGAVAADIRREAQRLPEPLRPKGELPPLGHFHLGADFTARAASQGMREADTDVLARLSGDAPIFLMVGTLEPRKGHAHVLAAMEQCWKAGSDARLVIVGKLGWQMDAMAKRLEHHPHAGRQLFWVEGASDDMLAELYQVSTALVAASEGEGFGLPLIEAAQWGIPIIARDIPVFREVAGTHASYFSATDAEGLARELEQWLASHAAGNTPDVAGMPWLSWKQSAEQLMQLVLPPCANNRE